MSTQHNDNNARTGGLSRRRVLRASAAGFALAAAPAPSIRRAWRASDELRVAVAGLRGRGHGLLGSLLGRDDVRVVALADVDSEVLASRLQEVETKKGAGVRGFADLRQLFDECPLDALVIATPNHLHAMQTIWACQRGVDVYVEKPVSHNVWEGGQMVAAARKYDRIVQTGTQSRSSPALRDAIAWLEEGHIGARTHGWGTCFKPRRSIGKVDGPQPIPKTVDWKLYMGPRGPQPLHRRQLHYDWHWQSPTGNGDVGNQGVHQIDQARWALGHRGLPRSVVSIGGRLGYDDDGDTANTLLTFYDYPDAPLVFEVRGMPRNAAARADGKAWGQGMDRRLGSAVGAAVHAEGGTLVFPSYTQAFAVDAKGETLKTWKGGGDHMANFLSAVRTRQRGDLAADIQEGHISSALAHFGSDSYQLGQPVERGELERRASSEPLLAHGVDRILAHLDANGVDLGQTPLTLGAHLMIDPVTGRYVDHDRANALARGQYVEEFTVPENV